MKRKRRKKVSPDAEALREVLVAMAQGIGHGGLTYIAENLGMSASATRKRLLRPGGGFDEATMRAVAFLMASKSDAMGDTIDAVECGEYLVTQHDAGFGWSKL